MMHYLVDLLIKQKIDFQEFTILGLPTQEFKETEVLAEINYLSNLFQSISYTHFS
jgi:hypothetical protein